MKDLLNQIGLNDKESELYLLLLKSPKQTAQQLADATGIKRTNVYRLLDELAEQRLVVVEENPIRKFSAAEPQIFNEILKDRQQKIKQTAHSLKSAMPSLRSQYSLSLDKPGVVHMAGTEGFERLLEDMVNSDTEVLIVGSNDQPTDDITLNRFQELLLKRKENRVKTRILFHDGEHRELITKKFEERGFEVRFIGTTPFKGEVALYENNVSFTVYDPSLITTVVTNVHIADTMRLLFEQLWQNATC